MPQNAQLFAVAREFDGLEPSRNPDFARLDHIHLLPPSSGTTQTFTQGQVVTQKDDGTNSYAILGTSGYTPAPGKTRIIKYTITMNEFGFWQYGPVFYSGVTAQDTFETTVAAFYRGYFKTQDLLPAALTDDATAALVGKIIRGTRTTGEILIG